jgi:hypothetical protein
MPRALDVVAVGGGEVDGLGALDPALGEDRLGSLYSAFASIPSSSVVLVRRSFSRASTGSGRPRKASPASFAAPWSAGFESSGTSARAMASDSSSRRARHSARAASFFAISSLSRPISASASAQLFRASVTTSLACRPLMQDPSRTSSRTRGRKRAPFPDPDILTYAPRAAAWKKRPSRVE